MMSAGIFGTLVVLIGCVYYGDLRTLAGHGGRGKVADARSLTSLRALIGMAGCGPADGGRTAIEACLRILVDMVCKTGNNA